MDLTCVDLDEKATNNCRNFFNSVFSNLKFVIEVAEAKSYLEKCESVFDLIWLDLYLPDSYSPLYFDPDFIHLLKTRLKTEGVLLVNAYGLPTQFKPLQGASAQSDCARLLKTQFSFVGTIPYRRNQTLVATTHRPNLFISEPHPLLSAMDKLSFQVQVSRVRRISEVSFSSNDLSRVGGRNFAEIDAQMRNGWKDLLISLRKYEVDLINPAELLQFIQNSSACVFFLDRALANRDAAIADFLPILCAGESYIQDLNVDWIFSWAISNSQTLKEAFGSSYYQIWLPQLWSLVQHPSKKYLAHCFQVHALFREV
ncbi:MAG TPA: hypothetical protein VGE46_02715 [Bdellovibrio sp.]